MPTDESADYYEDRRLAALAMSRAASTPSVQTLHLEFARRYAELAGATAGQDDVLSLHANSDGGAS